MYHFNSYPIQSIGCISPGFSSKVVMLLSGAILPVSLLGETLFSIFTTRIRFSSCDFEQTFVKGESLYWCAMKSRFIFRTAHLFNNYFTKHDSKDP